MTVGRVLPNGTVRRIRILLVEDDAHIRELMADLLSGMGHDVCGFAVTESEAIEGAALYAPDLMIVDVHLITGTGMSAMTNIHRRTVMPHIYMTGDPRCILPRGAIVLFKPFTLADLSMALQNVVCRIPVADQPRQLGVILAQECRDQIGHAADPLGSDNAYWCRKSHL